MSKTRTLQYVALALAVVHSACGGDSPTAPPVVAVPSPSPSPTPSPSPSAPTTLSCKLAAQKDCSHDGCCKQEHGDNLGEYVQLAIFDIQATRPDLVSPDGDVLDDENFLKQVAARIQTRFGVCAQGPSLLDDEIAIKINNDYSEQFDLILASGKVNVFGGYMTTCRPARF